MIKAPPAPFARPLHHPVGQNRQSQFTQAKADHDVEAQELELHRNTELTTAIHVLTKAMHAQVVPAVPPAQGPTIT